MDNQTKFKLANFGLKYSRFLTLGTGVLSAIFATSLVALSNHIHSDAKIGLTVASVGAIFIAAYNIFSLTGTYRDIANNFYEEKSEHFIDAYCETLITKYTHHEKSAFCNLSQDEKHNYLIVEKFINSMVMTQTHQRYSELTLAKFNTIHYKNIKGYEKLLKNIYEKEFKDSNLVAKSFVNVILHQHSNLHLATIYPEIFKVLWEINGKEFTDSERAYLETQLLDKKFNVQEDVFIQLGPKLQKVMLEHLKNGTTFESDYEKINANLISLHEKTIANEELKNKQFDTLTSRHQQLAKNSLTQDSIVQFEIKFNSIFEKEDRVLLDIKTLMFEKDKISFILNNFKDNTYFIEAKLFFDNDVDKNLINFNEEIDTLNKMKIINHPQFNEFKDSTLISMVERLDMIREKMITVMQHVNDSVALELTSQIEVNKAVLKAKM
jgi:hypothetical protein